MWRSGSASQRFRAALLSSVMTSVTSVTSVASAAEPAQYDDEVPIELARYLVAGATLLDAPSADFPLLPLPEGLRVLGAALWTSRQTVIAQVAGAGDALSFAAELRANLPMSGWLPLETRAGFPAIFQPPDALAQNPPQTFAMCLDTEGQLEIRPLADTLALTLQPLPPNRTCDDLGRRSWGGQDPLLDAANPRLQVPAGSLLQKQGSSSGAVRAEEAILTGQNLSLTLLSQHLAAQLLAQDWEEESNWQGNRSAGSRWRWVSEEGEAVWGQLEIILQNTETLSLRFSLARETFRPR